MNKIKNTDYNPTCTQKWKALVLLSCPRPEPWIEMSTWWTFFLWVIYINRQKTTVSYRLNCSLHRKTRGKKILTDNRNWVSVFSAWPISQSFLFPFSLDLPQLCHWALWLHYSKLYKSSVALTQPSQIIGVCSTWEQFFGLRESLCDDTHVSFTSLFSRNAIPSSNLLYRAFIVNDSFA